MSFLKSLRASVNQFLIDLSENCVFTFAVQLLPIVGQTVVAVLLILLQNLLFKLFKYPTCLVLSLESYTLSWLVNVSYCGLNVPNLSGIGLGVARERCYGKWRCIHS